MAADWSIPKILFDDDMINRWLQNISRLFLKNVEKNDFLAEKFSTLFLLVHLEWSLKEQYAATIVSLK